MFNWFFGGSDDQPKDEPQAAPVYTDGDDLVDANGKTQHFMTSEVLTANVDVQVRWNDGVPFQDNAAFSAFLSNWHAEHNPSG